MCETEVPSFFIKGSKFLLLDSNSDSLRPIQKVTLRVDPHGHIVYWKPWNVESQRNYIFTQDIVDIRTGKTTNEQSVSVIVNYLHYSFHGLENSDNIRASIHDNVLATRLMTVVDNVDFIHPNFTTLAYLEDNVKNLKIWAEFLFQLSYRRRRRHYGVLHHVRKRLAPFLYASDIERASEQDVKYFLELLLKYGDCSLCHARTNKERFQEEGTSIMVGKSQKCADITDHSLVQLLISMGETDELRNIYERMRDENEETVSFKNFLQFLNTFQRDPRLNEVDHPRMSERMMKRRLEVIDHSSDSGVTFQAFVHFLWSDFCTDSSNMSIEEVADMMHAPLSQYFINSSHNTYCKGLQVKVAKILHSAPHKEAIADVEMYRQVLLSGCRCVELDVWDGAHGPVVTHGPSIVMRLNEVPLKEVCVAIAESAFKTSPYPVLLSIENHLSKQQQRQMVGIFRETFREHLLDRPLPNYALEEHTQLPPPYVLKKKILIKAKRRRDNEDIENLDDDRKNSIASSASERSDLQMLDEEVRRLQLFPDEEEATSEELSHLVNYLTAEKTPHTWNQDPRFYLMCSLNEDTAIKFYKDTAQQQANEIVKHTSKRMIRVYPSNMRFKSDNFLPNIFWMMGMQMVALNFQTNCLEMLVNYAMFEQTAWCGYVKKPDCLNDSSLDFNFYGGVIPHRMPATLKVTVLSSMFLPKFENSSYVVKINLLDMPPYEDPTFQVRSTNSSGIYTNFDKQAIFTRKILLAETAFLQIRVFRTTDDDLVPFAYRILSVNTLQNGVVEWYRHVTLRTLGNRNLGPICLFMYFDIFYYVLGTQISVHSAYMNPFSAEKKEESLSLALRNPFAKREEIVEDDAYRQAILGTANKLGGETSRSDSIPPAPAKALTTKKAASKLRRALRKAVPCQGSLTSRLEMIRQNRIQHNQRMSKE